MMGTRWVEQQVMVRALAQIEESGAVWQVVVRFPVGRTGRSRGQMCFPSDAEASPLLGTRDCQLEQRG